jgi:uncharacterized membrane protein YtjA (UPF0391 family)
VATDYPLAHQIVPAGSNKYGTDSAFRGGKGVRSHARPPGLEERMLYYALVFLIVALIAGALGVTGVASVATNIAYVLFVVAVVLFLVHLISGRRRIVP